MIIEPQELYLLTIIFLKKFIKLHLFIKFFKIKEFDFLILF